MLGEHLRSRREAPSFGGVQRSRASAGLALRRRFASWVQGAQVGSNYITREGFDALEGEYNQLWKVERPRVTKEVQIAAAHGDRSENAEYQYGKKRLREIDKRIRFLQKRIDELVIVDPAPEAQAGKVYFGAWVTLEDEDGECVTYRVVGPDDFDPSRGWLSMDSPMGRGLLGKKVDDEFLVKRPKGDATFTVLEITYADPGAES
jgi:transcription elongation factor GreB